MSRAKLKQDLRRKFLAQRLALSPPDWRCKSDRLCQRLLTKPQFQQAQTVLTYASFRQEPDLSSLLSLPKTWGFPRCDGNTLHWHRWEPQYPLQPGTYGILEPPAIAPRLDPSQVDLLLVPALACDYQGYRLGYGGGFFDRLLAAPAWRTISVIGVVFDFAYVPSLPRDPWDQPLAEVCTD